MAIMHELSEQEHLWRGEFSDACVWRNQGQECGTGIMLFKRDFTSEIPTRDSELPLLDHGFGPHRRRQFPVDKRNGFQLEKRR
ncbi:hypothetical protein [Pseudomonas asplenii]|uniref:hypothetical protein n=1 Tax=Pseudomonas asplenii TaxID=53407 RepID=UPI00036061BD|nr:hypothetical protein [Pseudomonas fuscovaginae]